MSPTSLSPSSLSPTSLSSSWSQWMTWKFKSRLSRVQNLESRLHFGNRARPCLHRNRFLFQTNNMIWYISTILHKNCFILNESQTLGFLTNLGDKLRAWAFCQIGSQNQWRHWFVLNHSDLPVIMYSVSWIILTKYVRLGYLDLIDRICIVKCS